MTRYAAEGMPDMLITKVLPPAARAAEFAGDRGRLAAVAEESDLQGCSEQRLLEFRAARRCAHQALGYLGVAQCVVPRGERREPVWPIGVVGSITHCRGYCAAAVGRAEEFAAIGIDAEMHVPLAEGVSRIVMSAQEARAALAVGGTETHIECVVFSAKEAVYKAWYPLMRCWLGFEDVFVEVNVASEVFTAHLLRGPLRVGGSARARLDGRFVVGESHVVCAVAIPLR